MRYYIEEGVFQMFPAFRRGVVLAVGIDNREPALETAALLTEVISHVSPSPTETEKARISVWNAAYSKFGADPNRYTPSIRFLYEQIRRSKPPRSINKVVDLMNATSIQWTVPCGGDDLDALDGGDLCLGKARGDETFAPLFKPAAVENANPGEIIYYTPQTRRVMCRRWTWRNADFSKLTPNTRSVAINIDMMMPPFDERDLESAMHGLEELLVKFCGGTVHSYKLSPANPTVQIDV